MEAAGRVGAGRGGSGAAAGAGAAAAAGAGRGCKERAHRLRKRAARVTSKQRVRSITCEQWV